MIANRNLTWACDDYKTRSSYKLVETPHMQPGIAALELIITEAASFSAETNHKPSLRRAFSIAGTVLIILASAHSSSSGEEASSGREAMSDSTASETPYRLDTGDHLRIRFYDRFDRDDL